MEPNKIATALRRYAMNGFQSASTWRAMCARMA